MCFICLVENLLFLIFIPNIPLVRALPNPPGFIHCHPGYGENLNAHACLSALAIMPTNDIVATFVEAGETRRVELDTAEVPVIFWAGTSKYEWV